MRGYSQHPFPAEPDARACLAHWRSLTCAANAAFARADHAAARLAYEQALDMAEHLVAGPGMHAFPNDCLAALVVAHHNLADLHHRDGDAAAAIAHLCQPHRTLRNIAAAASTPDHARLCAIRHLGKTRLALLDWCKHHGPDREIDALLNAGAAALWPQRGDRLH